MRNLPVALSIVFCLFMLTGHVFAQKIELTWSPNPEPDIKEYVIYRAVSSPDAEEIQIATVSATETVYYDGNITIGEVYYYRIAAVDSAENMSELSEQITVFTDTPTDTRSSPDALPEYFELKQNYPNPFNPETNFNYSVAEQTEVSLIIYDLLGRKVKTLVYERKGPGTYTVKWKGVDESGNQIGTGIYFARLAAGSFSQIRKIVLQK